MVVVSDEGLKGKAQRPIEKENGNVWWVGWWRSDADEGRRGGAGG